MKFKFFNVHVCNAEEEESRLNSFCSSYCIASVEKQFVSVGENSFWSFCITYIVNSEKKSSTKKSSVDYREVLNEKDFAVYSKLRTLRKDLALKEGVPVYALFTNEQLAAMVTDKVQTFSAMAKIPGIGKARIEKYGESFLALLKNHINKSLTESTGE